MAPRAVRAVAPDDNQPQCDLALAIQQFAAAQREQTGEIRRLRLSVRAGIRQVQPACTAVRGLCAWWKKYGPWLLGASPGVLVAVGAISPSAAAALKAFFSTFGAG